MSCIFCEIVKGTIPSYKVWEDDATFAFLDLHPINEGHTLVIPKIHEPNLQDLDDQAYASLMSSVKKVSKMIEKNISPKRVGLKVEGWDVPHAHVHVVPLNNIDDISSKRGLSPDNDTLQATQQKIIN